VKSWGLVVAGCVLSALLAGCTSPSHSRVLPDPPEVSSSRPPTTASKPFILPAKVPHELLRIEALNTSDSHGGAVVVPAAKTGTGVSFACVGSGHLGWTVTTPDGKLIAQAWINCDGVPGRDTATASSEHDQKVNVAITGDFGSTTRAVLVLSPSG
jgi:hypothetical protein